MHSACIKINVGIEDAPLVSNVVKNVEKYNLKNPPLGFNVIF